MQPGGCGGFAGFLLIFVAVSALISVGFTQPVGTVVTTYAGLTVLTIACWMVLFRKRDITLGADGLLVRTALGRRFIPWGAISGMRQGTDVLFVQVGERRSVPLTLPSHGGRRATYGLFLEIQRARAAASSVRDATPDLAVLDRGDSTVEAWRSHLVAVANGIAGYRSTWVDPVDLERVLTDGTAPPGRRVAAALALQAVGDPDAPSKIRVASAACAEPEMRRALEAAADGNVADQEIEQAEERRARPRA